MEQKRCLCFAVLNSGEMQQAQKGTDSRKKLILQYQSVVSDISVDAVLFYFVAECTLK